MTDELSNLMFCVVLLVISGAMGGSFYVPFSKVRRWSWETYWLTQGLVAWLILPVLLTWLTVPRLLEVLSSSPTRSLVLAYLFGTMWGVGSLMCGLSLRYLGISLGMALVLGFTAAFGTLIPPIIDGTFGDLLGTQSGLAVLLGVAVSLLGIAACGYAGIRKESELSDVQKTAGVKEFALVKGFVLATLCGIMSAGMILGVWAGSEIGQVSVELSTPDAYRNNTVFMIVLAGGFSVNLIWCLMLGIKNRSVGEYVSGSGSLLLSNYALVSLAGFLWYTQIFLYGVGRAKMGKYDFASWSIFLAFVIAFSTIWGLILKEWKGVSRRTLTILWTAIFVLILSAIVTGVGSYLK